MKNKSIRQTINGNTYIITTLDWIWGKTVKVTDTGDSWGKDKTRYSKKRDWFHRSGKDIEDLIHEAVNDAVCQRENKIEDEREYHRRITKAVHDVSEVHENGVN